jgi:hypothetical protein
VDGSDERSVTLMSWEFVKIYRSILDSSIANDVWVRHVFMDLLLLAEKDGSINMTPMAISRRTCIEAEVIDRAIQVLSQPDPMSRNPEYEGRRLIPIEGQGFGWKIVNFRKYADLNSSTEQVAAWRAKTGVKNGHAKIGPFTPPTVEEVKAEIDLRIASGKDVYKKISPDAFFCYYDARGWLYKDRTPMKSWRSALGTWALRAALDRDHAPSKGTSLADLIKAKSKKDNP